MRAFFFDLALGLGLVAALVVIFEGVFRIAEVGQRIIGRRVLRAKMLRELEGALDDPKASLERPQDHESRHR